MTTAIEVLEKKIAELEEELETARGDARTIHGMYIRERTRAGKAEHEITLYRGLILFATGLPYKLELPNNGMGVIAGRFLRGATGNVNDCSTCEGDVCWCEKCDVEWIGGHSHDGSRVADLVAFTRCFQHSPPAMFPKTKGTNT
jgi:hypothetical protein